MLRQRGIGLMDVLFSCVICTLGLTVIMKMQFFSLKQSGNNQHYFYLSYCSTQIIAMVKANPSVLSRYVGTFPNQSTRPRCQSLCSAEVVAMQDMYDFQSTLIRFLPNIEISMQPYPVVGRDKSYALKMAWREENLYTQQVEDKSYLRIFQL